MANPGVEASAGLFNFTKLDEETGQPNLLLDDGFQADAANRRGVLRKVVALAAENGIPVTFQRPVVLDELDSVIPA